MRNFQYIEKGYMDTTTEQTTNEIRPIVWRLSIRGTRNGGLTPSMRVRFWLWSKLLAAALRLGYIVFVIGRPGSGKSVLLSLVTPGKVYRTDKERIDMDCLPLIAVDEIPNGYFSIDEPSIFDKVSFKAAAQKLAQQKRQFAVSSRDELVVNELFDNVYITRPWRRVLMVKLA